MLLDQYIREDVCARVPELAAEIDPILQRLDGLLDDDTLSQRARTDFGNASGSRWCMDGPPRPSKCSCAC